MPNTSSSPRRVALTGDRPTGRLHLGHYVGSLKNRLALQESCRQFVMIADMQALTDHAEECEKVRSSVLEVALDYLAVGLDPCKSTLFIQSLVPQLSELTMYYLNLVTWDRLKHNPTVKQEMQLKGFETSVPAGFVIYPVSQAADITAFKADLVPVGGDQLPMIEQTNEIVRRFNAVYRAPVLKEVEPLLPAMRRLPGTDGKQKMSKSLGNCIYLADGADAIAAKVKSMYTDPHHLRVEDPGDVENNPVFLYLDCFESDRDLLATMRDHYKRGGLGDVVVKRRLNEQLQALLGPIRERREAFARDPAEVMRMLVKGSEVAALEAADTLARVRKAMHLDYPRC